MRGRCELRVALGLFVASVLGAGMGRAQTPPPDHPAITLQGITYTPRSILARNMGTPEDQTTALPPHRIIGNIYYVGTRTLSSFLVVTPQGNILIDSTYERNVPTIRKSRRRSRRRPGGDLSPESFETPSWRMKGEPPPALLLRRKSPRAHRISPYARPGSSSVPFPLTRSSPSRPASRKCRKSTAPPTRSPSGSSTRSGGRLRINTYHRHRR